MLESLIILTLYQVRLLNKLKS